MKSKTPRHQLDKAWRYTDEMISRSPAVAFIWKNAEGWPVAHVTSNVHTIFGWSRDDFLTDRLLYADVVHPEDLPRISEEFARYSADTAAERVLHEPYRIITREGSIRWVEGFTAILRDKDGNATTYEGFLIDITDRKEMEERLHLIQFSIDRAANGIAWIDPEGRIIYANDEECRRLGYSREKFITLSVFDVDPTLTPQTLAELWSELRRKGTLRLESDHRTVSGEIFPVEILVHYIRFNNKEYSFAFRRDISERKKAEAEQKRLQTNLINAIEIANLGPWEHDLVNNISTVNDHFLKIYRTSVEDVGGYTMSSDEFFRRFIHPDDILFVKTEINWIMQDADSRNGHQIEHRILFPDGSTGYVAVRNFFVKDETGKLINAYGVSQDITERKLAERERIANLKYFESMEKVNQAIQGSGNDLDLALKNVLDICLSVFECDRAFLLHPCDPKAPSWSVPMERTRPEFPGNLPSGTMIPNDDSFTDVFDILLSTSNSVAFAPGSSHPFLTHSFKKWGILSQLMMAIHPKVGKPWVFGLHHCARAHIWSADEKGLFEKIAQRLTDSLTSLLTYQDLRKSEEFLSSILENIPDIILVKDADDLRILRVNQAGEKVYDLSREELIGKSNFDLMPEEQAKRFEALDREVLDSGVPVDTPEENIIDFKGEPRSIHSKKIPVLDENGKARHLLIILEDITELKKLQERLNHAQKLEALGTLSGGIAHDFNNILQPMIGYSEFLMGDLGAESSQHKYVEGIYNAALRAKDLVKQILAFSRQSDRKIVPVKLSIILKEVVNLCKSIIPSNIEISHDIQKEGGPISADPTQLHQVIMNLIINAYHAIEENDGKIFVCLEEIQLRANDNKGIELSPGRYAKLSITDSGYGMNPTVQEKIFEPYFTTKPQGKGSGLGLAVAYGIVKDHGGHINVDSEVGKGSTFNVYLPLMPEDTEIQPVEARTPVAVSGNEHILLVDDEEMIVDLGTRLLEKSGYRVTACQNGAEALEIFKATPDAFDLVVTDMNMPNMTGDRLARELISVRPDIPVIICTGFSEKISRAKIKELGVKALLMKPITVSEMTEKVRKVLDGNNS